MQYGGVQNSRAQYGLEIPDTDLKYPMQYGGVQYSRVQYRLEIPDTDLKYPMQYGGVQYTVGCSTALRYPTRT
jgi:hypothetical protein